MLFGQTEDHLAALSGTQILLHREVIAPFEQLREKARSAGFEIEIASGFRGFARQKEIWNLKATGKRELHDANGRPLDFLKLSPQEIVHAILRWSALPGASRHHWGTDFDVFDRHSLPTGYQVQLTQAEVESGGIFSKMHDWLDREMSAYGFYRPYAKDQGGVSPERWHLSYWPISEKLQSVYTLSLFETLLSKEDFELIDVVRQEKQSLFKKFVTNVSPPPIPVP